MRNHFVLYYDNQVRRQQKLELRHSKNCKKELLREIAGRNYEGKCSTTWMQKRILI